MIQFNLLPDVKLDYIRLKRLKSLMIGVSSLVAASSLVLAGILFSFVNIAQKNHLNNLDKDISRSAKILSETKEIDKKITVQNQLSSLPSLHEQKPKASNLFVYLAQITPSDTTFSNITIDFTTSSIVLSGNAKDLLGVNRFIDTIKFTSYSNGADQSRAFKNVILTSFSPGEVSKDNAKSANSASFQTTFTFEPIIFDNQAKVELNVPNTVTTRSQLSKPSALFSTPEVIKEKE